MLQDPGAREILSSIMTANVLHMPSWFTDQQSHFISPTTPYEVDSTSEQIQETNHSLTEQDCTFLRLPGEIRNIIYRIAFIDATDTNPQPCDHRSLEGTEVEPQARATCPCRLRQDFKPALNLLATCSQSDCVGSRLGKNECGGGRR